MTAVLEGAPISAYDVSAEVWAALRENYRQTSLTMTCGEQAIPKHSARGLRFFAHHPGAGCHLHETGPETAEHHAAKTALAKAGEATGWEAHIEYVSENRDWIADVLLIRGDKRIAVEVQWSPQSDQEFARRTRRYQEAGVECRWFLGPSNWAREVPQSYRIGGAADELEATVPGKFAAEKDVIPLADAARRLFGGELNKHVQARATEVDITYFMVKCYKPECTAWMSRWYVKGLTAQTRCGQDFYVELFQTSHIDVTTAAGEEIARPGDGYANGPWWGAFAATRVETVVQTAIAAEFRRQRLPPAAAYAARRSRQVPEGYVAALCPRCNALQGDSFLWNDNPLPREMTAPWSDAFPLDEEAISRPHLCTDVGNGRCAPPARASGSRFPGPFQEVVVSPARPASG